MDGLLLSLQAQHVGQGCLETDSLLVISSSVSAFCLSPTHWNSSTSPFPHPSSGLIELFCSPLRCFHGRFINVSPIILTAEWPNLCKWLRILQSWIVTLGMKNTHYKCSTMQLQLDYKSLFYVPEYEYESVCLCCGEFAWRGRADTLAIILANKLEATFTPKSCLT